ncbi:MAG: hypothetical protein N3D73_01615 [Candidatus Diapherotrites archaeon]|nr:hypothetical protein [Candidatus Diapherotrites archaeon]
MAKNKEASFKEFLISKRKSISPGLINVPVWIMQKAQKRIYSKKAKRHWRNIDIGKQYLKLKKAKRKFKSGWSPRKFKRKYLGE